ncbi:MAG: helix-turn-helix domain-containing protein [Actinomycetota bacterium]|nr:helix-turn-helix domain-containing protein [Actinomycetota bacterium]
METSDIVRIARQRAGLSQEQLGRRSGLHRNVIGRWERGRSEPSLAALRKLVTACELELVIHLAASDSSLEELAAEQLELAPSERLRRLVPPDSLRQTLAALRWVADVRTPAILIGDVAGALQGAPQRPYHGQVEIVSGDPFSTETELRAAGFEPTDSEARWREADRRYPWTRPGGAVVALANNVPGSTGFADLRRNSETLSLDEATTLAVAHPRDLLRLADASPRESARARVPGLRALLARRAVTPR